MLEEIPLFLSVFGGSVMAMAIRSLCILQVMCPVAMLLEQGRVSHSLLGQAAGSVVLGTWNLNFIYLSSAPIMKTYILMCRTIKSNTMNMTHVTFKVNLIIFISVG